jgi:hypothetical protein
MAIGTVVLGLLAWCRPELAPVFAADQGAFQTVAESSYTMRKGDSKELSKSLALFQAKRSAVEAAEKYFSRRERISIFGKKQEEIVNITADRVAYAAMQADWSGPGSSATYRVRIKATVQPADFIEAEIETLRQEKTESTYSLRKEMEPEISADSPPGQDIAGACRRIRKGALRPAIIYLDRLQSKYPNWSEIYELKALAYDLHHESFKMQEALQKACELGSTDSCTQLEMLAP